MFLRYLKVLCIYRQKPTIASHTVLLPYGVAAWKKNSDISKENAYLITMCRV